MKHQWETLELLKGPKKEEKVENYWGHDQPNEDDNPNFEEMIRSEGDEIYGPEDCGQEIFCVCGKSMHATALTLANAKGWFQGEDDKWNCPECLFTKLENVLQKVWPE